LEVDVCFFCLVCFILILQAINTDNLISPTNNLSLNSYPVRKRNQNNKNLFQDVGFSKPDLQLKSPTNFISGPSNYPIILPFKEPLNNNQYIGGGPDDLKFSPNKHSLVLSSIPSFSTYSNVPFGNNFGSSSFLVHPFSFLPNKLTNPNVFF
jgi:hypothetical protein